MEERGGVSHVLQEISGFHLFSYATALLPTRSQCAIIYPLTSEECPAAPTRSATGSSCEAVAQRGPCAKAPSS